MSENELHFGDNLDVLRAMPAASIDLIYLDPPFNSNANYNVLYGTKRGGASQAQSHAFEDTWKWGKDAQRALDQTAERHLEAGALLDAFQKVFAGSNMMAYLAMMGVRLTDATHHVGHHASVAGVFALIGIREDEHNLRNKVARGKFTAVFLLQCLDAIGTTEIRVK